MMKRIFRTLVIACIVMCWAGTNAKRLPDEGLKKAEQAEQHLKQNKPLEAISILMDLDRDYPGTAAVSLRLAQVYDRMDQPGPALFYYRRYMKLAGENRVEEAVARLQTLEKSAGVPEEAQELAKTFKEPTEAYGGPESQVKRSLAGMKEDGSIVELNSADDLKRMDQLKPIERGAESTGITVPDLSEATKRPRADADAMEDDSALAVSRAVEPSPPSLSATQPAAAEFPRDQQELDRHSRIRMQMDTPGPTNKVREPREPSSSASGLPATPGFFKSRRIEARTPVLLISNTVPGSLLTFSAIPKAEGKPVNIILAGSEKRTTEIQPGSYEVTITHQDSGYPPQTLLDKSFAFEFARNREYSRVFGSQPGE
jgi:hypothetical protein